MKKDILSLFACPRCGGDLSAEPGRLACIKCQAEYPIIDSIPRFVGSDNYATNFGFQWNLFRATQLDSHSGVSISRDRFLDQSGWSEQELAGKLVLDVGCGAGRFAEIALSLGARVVALDYSTAADACWKNLACDNLTVVQGDIYALPFKRSSFDFIYCFGVLQHTPDVERAFKAIPRLLKPQGKLSADVYPKLIRTLFQTKYWLRPLTKRLPREALYRSVQWFVPFALPVSRVFGRVPVIGRWLRHAIPVANYEGDHPLTREQLEEWAVLDTYDMLAPAHDHPQSRTEFRSWFEEAGFRDVEVFRRGVWVGRGTYSVP